MEHLRARSNFVACSAYRFPPTLIRFVLEFFAESAQLRREERAVVTGQEIRKDRRAWEGHCSTGNDDQNGEDAAHSSTSPVSVLLIEQGVAARNVREFVSDHAGELSFVVQVGEETLREDDRAVRKAASVEKGILQNIRPDPPGMQAEIRQETVCDTTEILVQLWLGFEHFLLLESRDDFLRPLPKLAFLGACGCWFSDQRLHVWLGAPRDCHHEGQVRDPNTRTMPPEWIARAHLAEPQRKDMYVSLALLCKRVLASLRWASVLG